MQDLRKLEARVKATDNVLVVIEAPIARRTRRSHARDDRPGSARCRPDLVGDVEDDDTEIRAFLRAHRHLFVPLADLVRATTRSIAASGSRSCNANPLYVDLDDDHRRRRSRGQETARRASRQARRRRSAARRIEHVSADGKTAMIQVRHRVSRDRHRPRRDAARRARDACATRVVATHPGVAIGFTGSIGHRASPSTTRSRRASCCRAIVTTVLVGARARALLPQRDAARAARRHDRRSRPPRRSAPPRSRSATSTPRPRSSARSSPATASTTASC